MPTTIGTSTQYHATRQTYSDKAHYINGRFWVFYSESGNFGYRTSIDGVTWGNFIQISATASWCFGLWHDEPNNKICYARELYSVNQDVFYRQGTLNSDGTITWDSNEVTVDVNTGSAEPSVIKDSNGYPWIGFYGADGVHHVVKASATDGSAWTVPSTQLWSNRATGSERTILVPLLSGKIMAINVADNKTVQTRLWNGSSWEAVINIALNPLEYRFTCFDVTVDGDNVLVGWQDANSPYRLVVCYYNSTWGSVEEVVSAAFVTHGVIAITRKVAGAFRIYYAKDNATIAYKDRINGSLGDEVIISSSETTMDAVYLNAIFMARNGNAIVVWKNKNSSPYNIRIEKYRFPIAVTKTLTEVLGFIDTCSWKRTVRRVFSEILGLVDTWSRKKSLKRAYVEIIGFIDIGSKIKTVKEAISGLVEISKHKIIWIRRRVRLRGSYAIPIQEEVTLTGKKGIRMRGVLARLKIRFGQSLQSPVIIIQGKKGIRVDESVKLKGTFGIKLDETMATVTAKFGLKRIDESLKVSGKHRTLQQMSRHYKKLLKILDKVEDEETD